jgi:Protein of unknown function (DUF2752)
VSRTPTTPARRAAGSPLLAPLATAVVVAAAWLAVAVSDPRWGSVVPACPLHALTGLWCPLCGGTRTARALAHGDLAGAAGSNVLVLAAAPVAAALWVRWVLRRCRDPEARLVAPSPRLLAVATVVLVAFAVVRNLPAGAWLAP